MQKGVIFDIKRYAIHDGPGIRTTVFMKGCPFSCVWCHNPESLAPQPQSLYTRQRCVSCGECVAACPEDAVTLTHSGPVTDSTRCKQCGICARACPSEARETAGRYECVEHLVEIIEKDVLFYDESGGGVTFSGGEPLMQAQFLLQLLVACGRRNIHRAVDTTGYADSDTILAVARHTELILFDLKLMDPQKHQKYTGVSNRKILDNLVNLARRNAEIIIRIPLIPGVNDDEHNIDQTGAFIESLNGVRRVDLLPYHDAARNKYQKLNNIGCPTNFQIPSAEQLQKTINRLESYGLQVRLGG